MSFDIVSAVAVSSPAIADRVSSASVIAFHSRTGSSSPDVEMYSGSPSSSRYAYIARQYSETLLLPRSSSISGGTSLALASFAVRSISSSSLPSELL